MVMIKRILLILLTGVKIITAQPVANNPFIPVPGSIYSFGNFYFPEYRMKQFNIDSKGENLLWDFSSVVNISYTQISYGTQKDPYFSPVFNAANFSVIKLGTENDTGCSYYHFSPDSFGYLGYSNIHPKYLMRAPYTDPNVHIKYPVKYKDSFTDNGYFEFIGFNRGATDSQLCISLYTNTVVVEGWGTIKLKTRTYDSVLKVKVNTRHVKRWYWDMGTIVYRNDTDYETHVHFISSEFKGPIISSTSYQPNGVSFKFQNDIFLSAPKFELPKFSIYPNPASSNVTISLPATSYCITDISGRKIAEAGVTNQSIAVENLSTGIYFLHLYDREKYLGCEKFCKE